MLSSSCQRLSSAAAAPLQAAHSPVLGWGCVLGRAISRPAPVLLHNLMPNAMGPGVPYRLVAGAAGSRHLTLLTEEGHLIMLGSNRHGQVGQPPAAEKHDESSPCFYDLGFGPGEAPTSVSCGTNFNIIYRRGTLRAVVIGNNAYGQLGAGHKEALNNLQGFGEWSESAPWWRGVGAGLQQVVCGHTHTVFLLDDGRLFSCGTNQRGELGIGSLVSPMQPQEITYFRERGIAIKKVAAGCSFSLFLAADGRVFGCGSGTSGQVEKDDKYIPKLLRVSRHPVLSGMKVNLLRVKDIGCTANMTIVVSVKNEVFLRGASFEYGFECPHLFRQVRLPATLTDIVKVVTAPNTVYLVGGDGAVYGFGGNTEGQLQISPGRVNVAPAFIVDEVVEVLPPPSCAPADSPSEPNGAADVPLIASSGFAVLIDERGRYPIASAAAPIQFPEPIPLPSLRRRFRVKF